MANLSKMTRASCNNLFNHYERKNGIKFGNQDINKERSYMNYNLAPIKNLSQNEILNKRLSEVKVLNREDVNVMCSWIVTLPKTIEENSKEEYKFFEKTYEFLKNMYGEKNIISSYVHKDEKTPHIHFAFIPIVIDRKKGIEKVSAYELLTRNHLKQFHNKLANYLNEYFQRDIGILNGATESGNKTILELKNRDLELKNLKLEKNMENISDKLKKYNITLDKIKNLEIKNTLIGNGIKGINLDDLMSIIKEATYSLEIQKQINISSNKIKDLMLKNDILLKENEKLKEELKANKLSLKNKIKEKNLFIDLKKEWEYQNKLLEKIPNEILEIAKKQLNEQKINHNELELEL